MNCVKCDRPITDEFCSLSQYGEPGNKTPRICLACYEKLPLDRRNLFARHKVKKKFPSPRQTPTGFLGEKAKRKRQHK